MAALPPVPALPDTERRTEYLITSQNGPFLVNFDIYGDQADFGAWVEVWLNGVLLTAGTDWSLSLSSGSPLATAPRPLTNAQVSLNTAGTGTLEIVGARRPRRLTQLSESQGVSARDFNQLYTDVIAVERERWDGRLRMLRVPPGETLPLLPPAANRKGLVVGFDLATGLVPTMYPAASGGGGGNVIGPVGSFDGQMTGFDVDGQHIKAITPTAHGSVALSNDTSAYACALIPYNGNSIYVWNPAASQWKLFQIPPPIAITNVTNNGSGRIRITRAASPARNFINGQTVQINGVLGIPPLTAAALTFSWVIDNVTSNTFDLVGSTFSGVYTPGTGIIRGFVSINTTNCRINDFPNQAIASDVVYSVGIRYMDAACTIAELVLGNFSYAPADDSLGFNVIYNGGGPTKYPLVGELIKHGGTIQGGAGTELVLGWYNRGEVDLVQGVSGVSVGTAWTKLTGSLGFLIWADDMPAVRLDCGFVLGGGAALPCQVDVGISFLSTAVAPDVFQSLTLTALGAHNISLALPFAATTAGFYTPTAWIRTQSGTATPGVVSNATLIGHVKF